MRAELIELARYHQVEFVDLRFTDLLGVGRHVTLHVEQFSKDGLDAGFPMDLECCAGPRRLVPVPATAHLDPFAQHPTLALICDVRTAAGDEDADDDPRAIARRAAALELADQIQLAADVELFVFDQACFDQGLHAARYQVDSREGPWRRGWDDADNLGTQIARGDGAGRLPPADSLHHLRAELALALKECGVGCRGHQRGPATAGQIRLSLAPAPLLTVADHVMTCKYVARNIAARHGKVATFMPQPLFGERGSGMTLAIRVHGHDGHTRRHVAGGLLAHLDSLMALTCQTTNSYRRLAPENGGPWLRAVGTSGSAVVRDNADALSFRAIDSCCNPYLAFAAVLAAGVDGVARRIEPGSWPDADAGAGEARSPVPATLAEALAALRADHAYLLHADIFRTDMLMAWIERKWSREVEVFRARPHPHEFSLYFDL